MGRTIEYEIGARADSLRMIESFLDKIIQGERFQSLVKTLEAYPHFYPYPYMKYLHEQGYLAADIPEQYGGLGMSILEGVMTETKLAEGHAGGALQFLVQNSLTSYPIARFGTEEQKEKYLRRMANGELFASFAITEPDTGSDAKAIAIRAEWDEKTQGYFVTGRKRFITGANGAGILVMDVRTGKPEDREAGISALIMEVAPGMEGFRVEKIYDKVGQPGSPLCELVFDRVWVPKAALLGKENEGWKVIEATLAHSRTWIAGQNLGIARRAYKEALAYGSQRTQFGKPLIEHQDYKNHLDVLERQIQIVEHLVKRAALKEEAGDPYAYGWASLAKWVACETSPIEALDAMLAAGGMGYTEELPFGRFLRDAAAGRIYEGAAHIQRKIMRNLGMPEALLRLLAPVNGQLYRTDELLPVSMITAAVDAWEPKPVKKTP